MSRLVKLNVSDEVWAKIESLSGVTKLSINSLITSIVQMTIEDDLIEESGGQHPRDSIVARALVLTGAGLGLKSIAESVGLKESVVSDILSAWRSERAAAGLDQ